MAFLTMVYSVATHKTEYTADRNHLPHVSENMNLGDAKRFTSYLNPLAKEIDIMNDSVYTKK